MYSFFEPKICQILHVNVCEKFRNCKADADLWIDELGCPCTDNENYSPQDVAYLIFDIINHPENKQYVKFHLTKNELDICHMVGAKWISRNKDQDDVVKLWTEKPLGTNYFINSYKGTKCGELWDGLFPSIKPGDCINVEDVSCE